MNAASVRAYSEDQQRMDDGMWGDPGDMGGGGIPSIGGPAKMGADLRRQLKGSSIPAAHYGGLTGFSVAAMPPGLNTKDAYGLALYTPGLKKITIEAKGQRFKEAIANGSVIHEMGHHVQGSLLSPEAHAEWSAYSNNGANAKISEYARTNEDEHFADSYRAYFHSKAGERAKLKSLEPKAYEYMRKVESGAHLRKGKP